MENRVFIFIAMIIVITGIVITGCTLGTKTKDTMISTSTTIIFPNSYTYTKENTRKNTDLFNYVNKVFVFGANIYAATEGDGLFISTDSGSTWTNKTTANGLGSNNVNGVYVSGANIYAATEGGLTKFWP